MQKVLKQQLGFKGLVFSDDLTMEGAAIMGGPADRAKAALNAGCDMVLMCNKRDAQIEALDHLAIQEVPLANSLLKKHNFDLSTLHSDSRWKEASEQIKRMLNAG